MDPILLRLIERLIVVLLGGMTIYLGYRLFSIVPHHRDAAGKLTFSKDISVILTRTGPGAFFALFGAVILATSLYQGIDYKETLSNEGETQVVFGGFTPADRARPSQADADMRERLKLIREIGFLNALPAQVPETVDEDRQADLAAHIRDTKLALMRSVWSPDWGDYEDFVAWIEAGAAEPSPEAIKDAAEYYHYAEEVSP